MSAVMKAVFGSGGAPSTVMILYLMRRFFVRFGALLIALIAILQLLDLLNASDDILAAEGATRASLGRYILLRAPELIGQFAPFTALLAVLITLGGFSQTSEITALRAAGVSVHGVLFPFGIGCAILTVALFIFNETVVSPGSAALEYWRKNDFAVDLPAHSETRTDVRLALRDAILIADAANRSRDEAEIVNLTAYGRDAEGRLSTALRADRAVFEDGAWSLFNMRRIDIDTGEVDLASRADWRTELTPDRFFRLTADPDHTSLPALAEIISALDAEGAYSGKLRTAFLSRFSGPLSTLLMPLLGAVAGFGLSRSGALLGRVAIGMGLGFSFFVADNLMQAVGGMGAAPAWVAAFGAFLVYLVAGLYVVFSMER